MIVRKATDDDIRHVAANLRADDRREQFAGRFDDDPAALAADVITWRQVALNQSALLTAAGEPAVIVGAYLVAPGVARFHMMSTEGLAEIGRQGHRWGKRRFIPSVLVPNVRMAETRMMADHMIARRWVVTCGFRELAALLPYGKHGELFVQIVWINPHPI